MCEGMEAVVKVWWWWGVWWLADDAYCGDCKSDESCGGHGEAVVIESSDKHNDLDRKEIASHRWLVTAGNKY